MSTRPHGYARYKLDACRCNTCGWARYQYDSRRNRLISQGRWQPFVDPAPVRARIATLRAAGLGTRQIADLAGLMRNSLQNIAHGRTRRVRTETAAGILAVPLDTPVAGKTLLDRVGTQRRGRALAALGWSVTDQAGELGWLVSNYYSLITVRPSVTADTARLVAHLYDRWAMTPPPQSVRAERARRAAVRHGWFRPLAWDEETLDDPDALPCLLPAVEPVDRELELHVQHLAAGHPVKSTPDAVREVIRRMPGARCAEVAGVAQTTAARVNNLRLAMRRAAA